MTEEILGNGYLAERALQYKGNLSSRREWGKEFGVYNLES